MLQLVIDSTRGIRHRVGRALWTVRGRPRTGTHFKHQRCRDLVRAYGCDVFIETGTFRGDAVAAMRPHVRAVHSIELFPPLYEAARERFAGDSTVHLHLGDSAVVLREVLAGVRDRALFWLDGHYSGQGTGLGETECPVMDELAAIAAHERRDHCVLIDDARLFGAHPHYPSVAEVERTLRAINPAYDVRVDADCIIALPPRT